MRSLLIFAIAWASLAWAGNDRCSPANYSALHPPRYPEDAIRAHATGKAVVRVQVNEDGSATNLAIESSAGFPSLDEAAIAAVSQWRFEAARCDGKAIASAVLVPVDFQLHADPSAQMPAWTVAPDEEPMEFGSLAEELHYLDRMTDAARHDLRNGYVLRERHGPKVWWVLEDPDGPWNAVTGKRKAILRIRRILTEDRNAALYAFVCGGTSQWCDATLDGFVTDFRNNPMPPPPSEHSSM